MHASQLRSLLERAAGGKDGFDCVGEGPSHRLRIWGRLPESWAGNLALQFIVLGLVMRVTALLVESAMALFAGTLGDWLSKSPRVRLWQERLAGLMIVGIGLRLIWMESPSQAAR